MSDPSRRSRTEDPHAFLAGGGELGERIREFDWSATPLGPIDGWPQSLRSTLSVCLNSNFPFAIYWGDELTLLYNDAWSPIPGDKHPDVLGRPAREAWPEIWDIIEPMFRRVLLFGESTRRRDQLLPLHRRGFTEECYFEYMFSPIRGENGNVEGVFNTGLETTGRIVGERRLKTLRELTAWKTGQPRSAEEACRAAAKIVAENPRDVPFALFYLLDDDGRASLVATAGLDDPLAPELTSITLDDPDAPWPLATAIEAARGVDVARLPAALGRPPGGDWPEPARRAVTLPLAGTDLGRPVGFVVVGISPRLALDEEYRGFLDLLAGHAAASVVNGRAYEQERRRVEERARGEERLRMALHAARMVAWEWDPVEDHLTASETLAEVYGLPPGHHLPTGSSAAPLVHPDDRDEHMAKVKRAVETRGSYFSQFRIVRPDNGAEVWLEERGHATPKPSGDGVRLVGVVLDVTERKKAESLLTGQKRVLEMVASNFDLTDSLAALCRTIEGQENGWLCLVVLLDKEGRRIERAIGPNVPDEMLRAVEALSLEPPYEFPCARAACVGDVVVVTDVAEDDRWSPEWRSLLLAHGVRACRSMPIVGPRGARLGTFTVARRTPGDPSPTNPEVVETARQLAGIAIERQRAQEALRESESRFRHLADAMPQVVWIAEAAGRVVYYNSRSAQFHGVSRADDGMYDWRPAVHPDDLQRTIDAWNAATANGSPYQCEHRLQMADGAFRWQLSRGVPVPTSDGQSLWFGTATDVHDLKAAQEALREADRRKDEFLATLAHELRNPLAPLRNGLQVMKLARHDDEAVDQARAMMERQLAQMVRLIDDLMDLSRISRGKVELRRERVELAKVVQQAVETSRPLIEANRHRLTVDFTDSSLLVDADATRLSQVFANLLNNAAKYTDPGGRIVLSVERRDGQAVVSVRDDGVGIPATMLPRVFEMFTQVDRSLEKAQGGLGIGLSLVKGLVEMHGGSVEARSDGPGLGSEFVVRLPAAAPSAVEEREAAESRPIDPTRRRVLVVDDNRDSALSLAMMLRLMGNDALTAHDGLEALATAESFRPDVILLDIGMPKLNGYDAAREIRSRPWGRRTLLIALTGWGQEDDRRKSHEAGFNSHLTKPVDPTLLERLLAAF